MSDQNNDELNMTLDCSRDEFIMRVTGKSLDELPPFVPQPPENFHLIRDVSLTEGTDNVRLVRMTVETEDGLGNE